MNGRPFDKISDEKLRIIDVIEEVKASMDDLNKEKPRNIKQIHKLNNQLHTLNLKMKNLKN